MGDIITLSFGQLSNNVTTHLYNTQDSLIPYTKTQKDQLKHDLSTFLIRTKTSSNTYNYSPNCLIYDVRNGLGSLSKYEYFEPSSQATLDSYKLINTSKPSKNEYQLGLDSGKSNGRLLNLQNTRSWTDFNKLIYNPRSLHTIQNFTASNLQHFNIPNMKFDNYNQGIEEFSGINDDELDDFRCFLERCDKFQGIQMITELDNGWSGFSHDYVQFIKDEYFNNSNKLNLWNYSIIDKDVKTFKQKQNLIKSFVELNKQSSLFIPLQLSAKSDLLTGDFQNDSNWHKSAIYAMFINSIWGLNSQLMDRLGMTDFQDQILKDNQLRKIINDVKIIGEDISMNIEKYLDIPNYDINLGISNESNFSFNKTTISSGEKIKNSHIGNIINVDTFPQNILLSKQDTHFQISMEQTSNIKHYLKPYKTLITNSKEDELIEDKNELIEDICQIINDYTTTEDSDDEYD